MIRQMGRQKTVYTDLPPRMVARTMERGKVLYYYKVGTKKIPLGSDLNIARMRWAEFENNQVSSIHNFKSIAEQYRRDILPNKGTKTAYDQGKQLDRLIAVFGDSQLDDIKPPTVRQYLDKRTAKTLANREMTLLSHIWNTAREWGYTEKENPVTGVRKNKEVRIRHYVEDADFNAVLNEADEPLKDAMYLAYYTGQRLADVLKMTRSDVHDGAIWVKQGKTGQELAITLEGQLKKAVDAMLKRTRTATSIYLVQTSEGKPLTYAMIRKRFVKAREDAGVDFTFRHIRPKAANDSGSLEKAQALLGHNSSETTKRFYRHIERVKPVHKKGINNVK